VETALYRNRSLLFLCFLFSLGAFCTIATLMDALPLLFTLIVFAFLVLLSFIYPEWMLAIVVVISILIPVDIAFKAGDLPRIGPTRGIIGAFLLAWFLRIYYFRQSLNFIKTLPYFKYIFLFLLSSFVSTIFSVAPLKSYFSIASLIIEQFLLFYILLYFMSKQGFWSLLKNLLFITTAFVCCFALYEELFRYNPILLFYPQEELLFRGGILRVRSTFFHPIALGCFLCLIFPFIFVEMIQCKIKVIKSGLVLLFLAVLLTSFLTVSRGPWIALLTEILIFLTWWCWKRIHHSIIIISVICLIITGMFFIYNNSADIIHTSLNNILNPSQLSLKHIDEASSEYYRIALFNAVTDKLSGWRWICGFGPGTFHLAEIESKYADHEHILTAADSHYINILFEYGLAGVVFFFFLLAAIIYKSLNAVLNCSKANKLIALAAFASIIGFIQVNITVSMFNLLPLTVLFWISVGICIILRNTDKTFL
jgi:hypothetical protein